MSMADDFEPVNAGTGLGYAERLVEALKDAGPLFGLTGGAVVEVVLGVRDDELDQARAELERLRAVLKQTQIGAMRRELSDRDRDGLDHILAED